MAALSVAQDCFRFRNDDGSEAGATFKAAKNVDIALDADQMFRLRVGLKGAVAGDVVGIAARLQYARNGGSYANVPAQGSASPVRFAASPHVTDDQMTTHQITIGTFRPGRCDDDGATSLAMLTYYGDVTEFEFVLEFVGAQVAAGDTFDFRVTNGGTALQQYAKLPRATIADVAIDVSAASRFFFAWTDAGTPFDPAVHNVEDEKIVRWHVEHLETEFATLSVDIRNPRIGLLNAGRKLWAWLSVDNAGTPVPLFFGRLVALPSNLHREVVTLQLLARPEDFGLQKSALAASLRVLPYYDPVFIKPEMIDDPDIVLEGRTQVWHIDRITHDVTISDLLIGEDGVEQFGEHEVPYDSVEVTLDQPPVRAVAVQAEVPWTQSVRGRGRMMFRNWKVPTLAGKGVIDGWPKPSQDIGGAQMAGGGRFELIKGDNLGGGWFADTSSARSPYMELTDGDWSWWFIRNYAPDPLNKNPLIGFEPPPFYLSIIQAYSASVPSTGKATSNCTRFAIIDDVVYCNLTLGYEAERKRKDTIRFTLVADSQPIVTMPDDADVIELKIAGNDVGLPVASSISPPSPPPEPPIGSALRRSYFTTDRGMQSIQYAIQMARARIVARSRAVSVKWKCKFSRAIELSLRKNALLHDHRLPGGQAVGKIVAYSFGAEGGEISGTCSIACCIGYGGAIAEAPGDPCYVDGYVDGYQHHNGQRVVLTAASDVGFEPLKENANDDGLIFPLGAVPIVQPAHNVTVHKTELAPVHGVSQGSTQIDDCGDTTSVSVSTTVDTGPYNNWLSGTETTVQFQMKAVEGGPFESVYEVAISDLKLPKQIDLESPPPP